MSSDPYGVKKSFEYKGGSASLFSLKELEKQGFSKISSLPFSIKILLEQALRNYDDFEVKKADIEALANWEARQTQEKDVPYKPTRVILQDFTGVPAVVDLASLRSAMVANGGDPKTINPRVPVDLVIDHSVQVDKFGASSSLDENMDIEFKRNKERYEFLKWGQSAFDNFNVVPPGVGIIHQVNLEHLANVVQLKDGVCFPDTLVGTDSHTTMINGVGVMGWGVGGLEAESVMLGQPIYMLIPQVIGFKIHGALKEGTTATDLVLRIVEMLRAKGVVEKFVEFYGPGLSSLSLADRATIANMAPEYGATMGFFPVDDGTLDYLKATGRSEDVINRVEAYTKEQGLFRTDETADPVFTDSLELDISTVEPALAGPKRPQDRINLSDMKTSWYKTLQTTVKKGGFSLSADDVELTSEVAGMGKKIKQGSVMIAAITSCTNTSNPSVIFAAGLLAKKAVAKGLTTQPWVKTSLAPGSRVVTDYLDKAGLSSELEKLGFYTVGYGCTTCIGNSGPLSDSMINAINDKNLVVSAVLSGNRNFEGRISPHIKANYLASPPLVVAYAIAGNVNIDLLNEPLGQGSDGKDVYLKDVWPTKEEIMEAEKTIAPEMYRSRYQDVGQSSDMWNSVDAKSSDVYPWDENSTYIQNPPFFTGMGPDLKEIVDIKDAKALVMVADSVTTDHISPAGAFAVDSPAGKYLTDRKIGIGDFNSYGSRRGNDRIMTRGTFANVRLRNQLADGKEGGYTKIAGTDEIIPIFDAAQKYKETDTNLIVLAGSEYGTGSSRDWAAKGTFLLGIKAVIATSFERIHRSNLVGMGVLPLVFKNGESPDSLGLTGHETFSIQGLTNELKPLQELTLDIDGKKVQLICRLDTPVEIQYYRNGGILHTVLRNFMKNQ